LCGGEKLTEIAADAARVPSSVYTLLRPSGKSTSAGASPVTARARTMHLGRAARARLFGRAHHGVARQSGNGSLDVDGFAEFPIGPAALKAGPVARKDGREKGSVMPKLQLSVAVGDYDRTRALIDGSVQIDGVDPVFMTLVPEEIFFRAFRGAEFDICEVSLSSYSVKTAQGNCPYIAVPAFVSRAFRHTSIYVRRDRVKKPEDLKGRKVGVPEYQLTANVWARAFLEDDYGVKRSDIHWIRGGIEEAGRPEKILVKLPPGVRLDNAPEGKTISALLESGEIDGFVAPRPPTLLEKGHPHVGWLFDDPTVVAKDYYKRTGFFPIMHAVGIRRVLADKHPWLPGAVLKAFEQAKAAGLAKLSDTSATKVTLPFVEERLAEARALMGHDFWSYGVEPNRKVLDYFLAQHHAEGLSARRLSVDELFHPATYETFKL
jgi:4,5-dihydroxyphthalate decarboxylase